MQDMLAAGLALLTLLFLLALVPLAAKVVYRRAGQDDHLVVVLEAGGGLWGYELEVSGLDLLRDELSLILNLRTELENRQGKPLKQRRVRVSSIPWPPLGMIRVLFRLFSGIRQTFIWLLGRMEYKDLVIQVKVGAGDPFRTAMLVGGLWAVLTWNLRNLHLQRQWQQQVPQIAVAPNFSQKRWDIEFACILGLRAGHIMLAGIRFGVWYIGNWFRERVLKHVGTPH